MNYSPQSSPSRYPGDATQVAIPLKNIYNWSYIISIIGTGLLVLSLLLPWQIVTTRYFDGSPTTVVTSLGYNFRLTALIIGGLALVIGILSLIGLLRNSILPGIAVILMGLGMSAFAFIFAFFTGFVDNIARRDEDVTPYITHDATYGPYVALGCGLLITLGGLIALLANPTRAKRPML